MTKHLVPWETVLTGQSVIDGKDMYAVRILRDQHDAVTYPRG